MKMFAQAAVAAALGLLVSSAGYAAGPAAPATFASAFMPMVLAAGEPAVDASISPGAGPMTSSEPVSRSKPLAKTPPMPARNLQSTEPRTDIAATAASQGMPALSQEAAHAAYAGSDKSVESPGHASYAELNRRVEALSKEIATLREELNHLKTQEAGAKH